MTALSGSQNNAISSEMSSNGDRRLLLVFEKATEGSLLDYLGRVLPELSFMQAWDKITGIISNVANGLNTLHRHNIIHR